MDCHTAQRGAHSSDAQTHDWALPRKSLGGAPARAPASVGTQYTDAERRSVRPAHDGLGWSVGVGYGELTEKLGGLRDHLESRWDFALIIGETSILRSVLR